MDKKTQIHEEIMSFLSDYLESTPKDIIQQEIANISTKNFKGPSANDYFINFHKYHLNLENQISSNVWKEQGFSMYKTMYTTKQGIYSVLLIESNNIFYYPNKQGLKYAFKSDEFNFLNDTGTSLNVQKKKYEYV